MKEFDKTRVIVRIQIDMTKSFWRQWLFTRFVWLGGWSMGAKYRLPVNSKWCGFGEQQKWKLFRFWKL